MGPLLYIVLPACLATSFVCAGMEAGVFTLGRWRIAQQMRDGKPQAARLYAYLQNAENFLWTILVGNIITLFFAMWILAVALMAALPGRNWAFWGAFAAAAFMVYAFCDLLPKTLFRKFPNRLCLAASGPFRLLHLALAPLVFLVERVAQALLRWTGGRTYQGHVISNRQELRQLMEDPSDTLSTEERGMIRSVLDLHAITVREIAIPFARFPQINAAEPLANALAHFRASPQTILPVWNTDARQKRVAGFLEIERLIFAENAPAEGRTGQHLTPVLYLNEDLRVHDALRRLQRTGYRMAVVLSRDRRDIGVVTLEEILKKVFGEVKL